MYICPVVSTQNICLKIYEGASIQQTLLHAIDHFPGHLKTLIIGCPGAGGYVRACLRTWP